MKNLLINLVGIIVIGATLPAFAGPDFQQIEQGRKAKIARMHKKSEASSSVASSPASASQPAGNDAQHDKRMQECMEMMKNN